MQARTADELAVVELDEQALEIDRVRGIEVVEQELERLVFPAFELQPVVEYPVQDDPGGLLDLPDHHQHLLETHRCRGEVRAVPGHQRPREAERHDDVLLHFLDLFLDVEDLPLGAVGLDRDVEGYDQAALEVHLVDHVPNLFEHLLVGHDHLLAERAADFEKPERRGPAFGDGLFGPAVIAEKFDGLERGKDERVAPWREGWRVPLEVEHLLHGKVQSLVRGGIVFRRLPGFDEPPLSVLDLDRNRVDADQFLQVLAVLGVAFESDGVAFDQELENHVLDELGDAQAVGDIHGLPFHLLVIARDLDFFAHGEGAPGVDAVLHQRLFEVVLPGLARPVLPGGRDRFGGVDLAEHGRVQGRGGCQRNEHQTVR